MAKKLTHEEFMEKFYAKNKNAENIEILGIYINKRTKIKCKCKIDGYEWETTPSNLLKGTGCPKCKDKKYTKTHEEFIKEMKEINPNIEILGEYVNKRTKIKCKCKIDNHIWYATPNNLLYNNSGCPKCVGKIRNKTTEYFIQELQEINDDIEILGEYKGALAKIKCRCKIDGYEWYTTPSDLLNHNTGCPKCSSSKGEKRIAKYLDSKNIKYIHDEYYFKDLKGVNNGILRPDFIIENLKIWIEYDGEQHFRVVDFSNKNEELAKKQFKIIQENDRLKNEYAKKHNWKIIRIPYWDFDRIEEILDKEL